MKNIKELDKTRRRKVILNTTKEKKSSFLYISLVCCLCLALDCPQIWQLFAFVVLLKGCKLYRILMIKRGQ